MLSIEDAFLARLPDKVRCGDDIARSPDKQFYNFVQRDRAEAIHFQQIDPNPLGRIGILPFDVDHGDFGQLLDSQVAPNVIVARGDGKTCHAAVLVREPVMTGYKARKAPQELLIKARRGLTRLYGADARYTHETMRSPFCSTWRTQWVHGNLYDLEDILCELPPDFLTRYTEHEMVSGGNYQPVSKRLLIFAWRVIRRENVSEPEVLATRIEKYRSLRGWCSEIGNANDIAQIALDSYNYDEFIAAQRRRGKAGNAKRWSGHVPEWRRRGYNSREAYYKKRRRGGNLKAILPQYLSGGRK